MIWPPESGLLRGLYVFRFKQGTVIYYRPVYNEVGVGSKEVEGKSNQSEI